MTSKKGRPMGALVPCCRGWPADEQRVGRALFMTKASEPGGAKKLATKAAGTATTISQTGQTKKRPGRRQTGRGRGVAGSERGEAGSGSRPTNRGNYATIASRGGAA